jgi:hypothetical protein
MNWRGLLRLAGLTVVFYLVVAALMAVIEAIVTK